VIDFFLISAFQHFIYWNLSFVVFLGLVLPIRWFMSRVHIIFFTYFLFQSHYSMLIFFFLKKTSFMVFFVFLFIWLFQSLFLCEWFFFLVSSFNIWFVDNGRNIFSYLVFPIKGWYQYFFNFFFHLIIQHWCFKQK
jgi:hypothetical protein